MDQVIGIGGAAAFALDPPRWRRSADGWDTGTQRWWVPVGFGQDAETLFARGAPHPDRQWMRVVDMDFADEPSPDGDEAQVATVQFRGLLEAQPDLRPIARSLRGLSETSSGQNIFTPAWSGGKPAEISEPRTGYEVAYIQTFDSLDGEPDMTQLGRELTPPQAPTPAPFFWDFLSDAIYLFPRNWVLEDRTAEQIPGAPVWFVRDRYKFQYPVKPGDV